MQEIQTKPHTAQKEFTWEAWEYPYRKKSPDWYWGVGLVALALAVFAIMYNNVLFAVLIVVGTLALLIHALRKPRLLSYRVAPQGIFIGKERHPYSLLHSFWVSEEDEADHKLIIQSKKLLSPYLIMPLAPETEAHTLREFLFDYLPEEEHREPVSHKLMELLGF